MKIYQVVHVTVVKQSDSPVTLLVQAQGFAASTGWRNLRLEAPVDLAPRDGVLELSFEADRLENVTPPVIAAVTASAVVQPADGAEAVVVSGRTNSVAVHASQFQSVAAPVHSPVATAANLPDEHQPRFPGGPTTLAILPGEHQGRFPPGPPGGPTTRMIGEQGAQTTAPGAGVESGPQTDPIRPPSLVTTLAMGEEDTPPGGGNPFGQF